MFTGIVEELGTVREASPDRLVIAAAIVLGDTKDGDSLAVNGACLTVVELTDETFAVDLSAETLARTSLGSLKPGDPVDLERALTPTTRMGGHVVQGHVDGVGTVASFGGAPAERVLSIEAPAAVARYIVEKGFVAVDGVSLTVTEARDTGFSVAVIPYTLDHTVLRFRKAGDPVNIEVDILAKYVERLMPKG
ncbi:MAG: riboflavin synthase [Chloroflexi bacterium]|nr:riboflavin synthase [Chloroflexota bacterium]